MKNLQRVMRRGPGALRDQRAEALRLNGQDPEGLEILEDLLGREALRDRQKVEDLLRARAEVKAGWRSARESFLTVGRALLAADVLLTTEEQNVLAGSSTRFFGFDNSVASKLRRVAQAVDGGRIPEDQCPVTYSVAYQLARLDRSELDQAAHEGLVRPDVTRVEIQRFERTLRGEPRPGSRADPLLRVLRLRRRRDALRVELADIERLLRELDPESAGEAALRGQDG